MTEQKDELTQGLAELKKLRTGAYGVGPTIIARAGFTSAKLTKLLKLHGITGDTESPAKDKLESLTVLKEAYESSRIFEEDYVPDKLYRMGSDCRSSLLGLIEAMT